LVKSVGKNTDAFLLEEKFT